MAQQTPTEVIAAQVREFRDARKMSAQALADRCAELGMPDLKRQAITNLENSRRGMVTVDELLVLAEALDVPPARLFIPLDGRTDLAVTPEVTMSSYRALFWVSGENVPPLPAERLERWREAVGPLDTYRTFRDTFRAAAKAETRGDVEAFRGQLSALAKVIEWGMLNRNITPPALPAEWVATMRDEGWLDRADEVPVQAGDGNDGQS
ncbi:helix-turn-helix domain-containing protein [Actinomadura xylanilytica]|uniref:helix-turn-helix domain-containing protein n=1 Tax=Actinomadura xylanilytica TaxID=887459 RepID=UPI00255A8637|nr:helix-turn-helix transcriptional regulator [Actinomadura xylanilytica]MDL4772918.1 helix-turn-helix transcriptional regulator [Actinomadura xylanilytica]